MMDLEYFKYFCKSLSIENSEEIYARSEVYPFDSGSIGKVVKDIAERPNLLKVLDECARTRHYVVLCAEDYEKIFSSLPCNYRMINVELSDAGVDHLVIGPNIYCRRVGRNASR